MSIHWGGRGPGHVSRLPKAANSDEPMRTFSADWGHPGSGEVASGSWGNYVIYFDKVVPNLQGFTVTSIALKARNTGTVTVHRVSESGADATSIEREDLTVSTTGWTSVTPTLEFRPGDYIGISDGTADILDWDTSTSSTAVHGLGIKAFVANGPDTILPGGANVLFRIDYTYTDGAESTHALYPEYVPTLLGSAGWQGLIGYGQSNVGGSDSDVLTTTQPYSNKTFGGGVQSGKSGSSSGAVNTSPGTSTSIALVETAYAMGSPGADGGYPKGEMIISSAANYATELSGLGGGNFIVFGSAAHKDATAINFLIPGQTWYQQLKDHVTDAAALATAASKTYKCQFIMFVGCESNIFGVSGTPYNDMMTMLDQLYDGIQTDVLTITGQSEPVHILFSQPAGGIDAGDVITSTAKVNRAIFDHCHTYPLSHLVTPNYIMPCLGDSIHYTAEGYRRLGHYMGRAVKNLAIDNRTPDALVPELVIAEGTTLTCYFRVPTKPLVFDTTNLGTVTDHGFKVVDDTGTLTLSNITASGRKVTMTLNRTLGANPKLRHAIDYEGSLNDFYAGANGNLRDSTGTTVAADGAKLWHVAPGFEMEIIVDPTEVI